MSQYNEWFWPHRKFYAFCLRHEISSLIPDWLYKRLTGKQIGTVSQFMFPITSWCLRCKTSWMLVENHGTSWSCGDGDREGMFPLCERCFSDLTIEERIPESYMISGSEMILTMRLSLSR